MSLQNDDDHTVEVIRARGAEQHVMYSAPAWEPGSESQVRDTSDALRSLLDRVTEQVREAGHTVAGDWTVNWSRCYVFLAEAGTTDGHRRAALRRLVPLATNSAVLSVKVSLRPETYARPRRSGRVAGTTPRPATAESVRTWQQAGMR